MLAMYVRVTNLLDRLRSDERGVTAVEYAVMASAIAVAVGATAITLGTRISGIFNGILPAAGG